MCVRIFSLAHDHPAADHLGRRKTSSRLSTRVYWPEMHIDVLNYTRG